MTEDGSEAALEEAFFEDLKRVEHLRRQLPVGVRPSLRNLANHAQRSHNTIDNWLSGKAFPADVDVLAGVIAVIGQAATRAGFGNDAVLLDPRRWRERHDAVNRARVREAERARRGQQAGADLMGAEARARSGALADPPQRLDRWTAAGLRVHPSISGMGSHAPGFVLPSYVQRPHDQKLREALRTAAGGVEAVLVVVRGSSCTGKTRAAYEAVRHVRGLDDWELVFPRTASSALEVMAVRALVPRTILWLDDAHQLLSGSEGEDLAAGLLSRLTQPGPVIVVATLWDAAFTDLTSPPRERAFGSADPHRHARALLTGATTVVRVPPAFGAEDLRALDGLEVDPALAAARCASREGKITQTLAAGLQLVDRYESAQEPPACYTRALVTAAMDAYRLGWDAPLPDGFLRDAAPGYLTDEQRTGAGPHWFASALTDARARVQRVAAALEPVPRAGGMGAQPGVSHLADYLDAHGRATREHAAPPQSFWTAAADHAKNAGHLARLSREAEARGQYHDAERLAGLATDAGDAGAYAMLAELRERAGDRQGAERLAQLAADGGDPRCCAALAWMRERAGDPQGAERLARLAAVAGDTDALRSLTGIREQAGDHQGAERLARMATEAGDRAAFRRLGRGREQTGDAESAERLYELAAGAGDRRAYNALARVLERAGNSQGAEETARLAADTGSPRCYTTLAWMRERAGDHQSAERLARLAADAGDRHALRELAELRERAGDPQGAERLARMAAVAGDTDALRSLTEMRERAGDHQGAERLARLAADAGDRDALRRLDRRRKRTGGQ
ncbi:sel1 repeat family protein [Streptomyces sp. ISL-100]|uniref:sel1 repeat family protein n=1 Tax=Streptomyces sp. ISL-100 TaxID=2819173 RepID=UPI001BE4E6FA|nr:sel1 repeat family protein [Streptomyces sp. ISL-100]MBT2401860.1 sel1 repeat family protein [Streptomyces sp. ISL-100]